MEQPIIETPLPQPKPEIKPVEGIKGKVQEWTEKGRDWLARLRGKVDNQPKEVIEEIAEAPKHATELVKDNGREPKEIETEGFTPPVPEDEMKTEKLIETTPFGYKQPVIKLPGEKIVSDESFPSAQTNLEPSSLKEFAVQVADSSATSPRNDYMIATDKSGRQLLSEPIYDIDFEGRHLTTVLVKSTGMPEAARKKWRSYRGQEEPFFSCMREDDTYADTRTSLSTSDRFLGLAVKEDQKLDAEKSLQLHKAGVKARIPLSGWQVKELRVGGEWRDIKWFKDQGYQGDELFQSAWAITCPLRLQDINDFLTQAVGVEKNPSKLDPLLHELIQLAKKDQSQPYQELATKWGEVNGDLTKEQRVALWTDFGIALSRTMGQNLEALSLARLTHGNLHDQNITFFGEICDNSEVENGQLKSGFSQKIGDDVTSFAGKGEFTGIKKFASKILSMEGKDGSSEVEIMKVLNEIYFPAVRQGWKGYEEWVKINTQELTDDAGRRKETKARLAESYGESNITEDMITREIIIGTGGENRFRAYG